LSVNGRELRAHFSCPLAIDHAHQFTITEQNAGAVIVTKRN